MSRKHPVCPWIPSSLPSPENVSSVPGVVPGVQMLYAVPMVKQSLKLAPLLVPLPLSGKSVQELFGRFGRRSLWRRIRADALAAANHRCEMCREQPNEIYGDPLHCHEVWVYDDKKRTATLTQFRMECEKCHLAIHMVGEFEDAVTQICKINGISRREAVDICDQATAEWQKRSKKTWKIQVTKPILKQYPQLAQINAKSAAQEF